MMTRDDIMAVQRLLRALGRDVAIDGDWGKQSRAAASEALRAATGAVEPAAPNMSALVARQPFAARLITGLVIHCSATPEGRDHTAAEMRRWHMGPPTYWSDLGYHYVVRLDGTVEAGRPEARVGSHVKEANVGTLGIVYVGGVAADGKPKDTRTPEQKAALLDLCRALMVKYPKIAWVKGHNDFTTAKACPSFSVSADPLGML
jgi:N-acetylmuramoyl-L-alanine amidase